MDMNYYQMLGVSQDASKDTINKAYRSLIAKYHPDIKGKAGEAATAYLNTIHDTLTDDDKRKAYDDQLIHGTPPASNDHPSDEHSDDDDTNLDDDAPHVSMPRHQPIHEEHERQTSVPRRTSISSPDDVRMPWSIRFIIATIIASLCYPLFSHVIGRRITDMIPKNVITAMIPSTPFILPAVEILCMMGLGYVLMTTVHSRFMHLVVLALGSAATIAVMSIVPYYQPEHLYAIIWILMPLFVIGYDVVRVMDAKRYEQLRRTAIIEQRHLYMIQSLRLNDNHDAYVVLLADERNMHTQKTIWGRAKLGDYVILGSGDEIEQRLGYRYSTHWSDIISRHFTSRIFTGGNVFRQ